MENVTLIGMPGSGKSTVGALLAKRLGWSFLDVDPLIVAAYRAPDLQVVLDTLGNERFLDAEADVIAGLHCEKTVLAPGGSAVLREKGARRLKELGPVVYLEVPPEKLVRRLGNLATRGVTLAPGQTIADLCAYRRPFYEKYADITVDADQPRVEDTVGLVLDALGGCDLPRDVI